MVTERPLGFVLACTFVLLLGVFVKRFSVAGTLFSISALLLFLSPIVGAYFVGSHFKQQFSTAFGVTATGAPFTLSQMVQPRQVAAISYSTFYYTPTDNYRQSLDFYKAGTSGKRPCIVAMHGGGWKAGDKQHFTTLYNILARAGYNVAAINYRLAPEFKSPAAVNDVHAAVEWLRTKQGELGIDTLEFILLGRSAGGQIALCAAYDGQERGIAGVINMYGPTDLVWGYAHPGNRFVFRIRDIMEDYIGGNYSQMPQAYAAASPIYYATSKSPPTLLIQGENDPLVDLRHSTQLDSALTALHVPHAQLLLPWAGHSFDYTLDGPGGQLSTYAILLFLRQVASR